MLLLLFLPATSPKVYYVKPTGSDAADGLTIGTAWQTVGKVNGATFNPGDSVLFEGGQTFTGTTLTPPSAGTSGNLITFGSYGGGRATINAATPDLGVFIWQKGGIRLENLIIVGDGANGSGVFLMNDEAGDTKKDAVQVYNCDISGFSNGLLIGGEAGTSGFTNVLIDSCDVHGNAREGIFAYGIGGLYANADITVTNCTAYDNGFSGILLSSTDGGLVEFCEAYGNGALNADAGGGSVGIWCYNARDVVIQHCESHHNETGNLDGGGFDIDGGCTDCVIRWCYTHDNAGPGVLVCTFSGSTPVVGALVYGNISQNDGQTSGTVGAFIVVDNSADVEAYIYNNTIYGDGSRPLLVIIDSDGTAITGAVANNILYRDGTNKFVETYTYNPTLIELRGNDYFGTGSSTLVTWNNTNHSTLAAWRAATGQETESAANTSLAVDPLLVDPGNGGTLSGWAPESLTQYRLRNSSPVAGAGVNLVTLYGLAQPSVDFYGTTMPGALGGYDIGATAGPLAALDANAGSYAWTGSAATLSITAKVVEAAAGSYALTGTAATLSITAKVLEAAAGSYAWTGADAALEIGRVLDADGGVYEWAGTDADLAIAPADDDDGGSGVSRLKAYRQRARELAKEEEARRPEPVIVQRPEPAKTPDEVLAVLATSEIAEAEQAVTPAKTPETVLAVLATPQKRRLTPAEAMMLFIAEHG
jgi:parallel beta-helix repeat protein